jgi:carbamoyltransferase
MKYYLGVNFGHDSAIAVISEEGRLVFAIEEGRLIREKNSSKYPVKSISIIKEKYDIIEISEGWNIFKRLLYKGILHSLKYGIKNRLYFKKRLKKEVFRFIKAIYFYELKFFWKKKKYVGHHLSHAYSLLPWGIRDGAMVFVSDTMGENESISCFFWKNNEMKLVSNSKYPNSIGSFFHQFAYHLGFEGNNGPGKLMAFSSLGNPVWYNEIRKIFVIKEGVLEIKGGFPSFRINNTWLLYANKYCENASLKKEIIESYKNPSKGKDLAASVQKVFSEVTIELILQNKSLIKKKFNYDVCSLGLSGGSALNCQANYKILEELKSNGVDSLIIAPWSNDCGTAIGAAAYSLKKRNPNVSFIKVTPFLGINYEQVFSYNSSNLEQSIDLAVDSLIKGRIIGLHDGDMEFGPRALGGRSILAKANCSKIKKRLNEIKKREDFMPFAPICLSEDNITFFNENSTDIMSIAVPIKDIDNPKIKGAIHENKLARVQVLDSNYNEKIIYKVLKKYKEKTGDGVLLLTSLNGNGKAIPYSYKSSKIMTKSLGLYGLLSNIGGWEKTGND